MSSVSACVACGFTEHANVKRAARKIFRARLAQGGTESERRSR